MPEERTLTVQQRVTDEDLVLEFVGSLDLRTTPQLPGTVLAASDGSSPARVILDLRRVEHLDSAGLAFLVDTTRALKRRAGSVQVLLAPGSQPERVIRLGGLDVFLNVTDRSDPPA